MHNVHPSFWQTTPATLLDRLLQDGTVHLPQAVPCHLVHSANAAGRAAFLSPEGYLARQKYSSVTRVGYTSFGTEGKPNTLVHADRHCFDYKLGAVTLHPADVDRLFPLYQFLVSIAWDLVRLIDIASRKSDLSYALRGAEPILRLAESNNDFVDEEKLLFPPHTDWDLFTFFLCGMQPGLQGEIRSNGSGSRWADVGGEIGDLFVSVGTVFQQYFPQARPWRHRVAALSPQRFSMFMYVDPAEDTILPSGERAGDFLSRHTALVRRDL